MIGYDLVSLRHTLSHRLDNRFFQKTLLEKEKKNFLQISAEDQNFWILWAIKESCFKSIPNSIQPRFNPLKIEINQINFYKDYGLAESNFQGESIYSVISKKEDQVEVISRYKDHDLSKILKKCFILENLNQDEISSKTLQRLQADIFNENRGQIQVIKSDSGKPITISSKGHLENISISHHGNRSGFAFLPS